jgi:hypothetical protein
MSRIQPIIDDLIGTETPDDLMLKIMEVLPQAEPNELEVGNFCTFIYQPKTFFVQYDEHPLVAVTLVDEWGIRGINYHWNEFRNYSWDEFIGEVYLFDRSELSDLRTLQYQKYRLNI